MSDRAVFAMFATRKDGRYSFLCWRAMQVTGARREPPRSFRLGFFLGRVDEPLLWLPERRYRGLDREPFVPFLDELSPDEATVWRSYLA